MDRKSCKKIIRYIFIVFIISLVCVTGVYFVIRYIVDANVAQINELEGIYPELSEGMNQTSDYYNQLYEEMGIYLCIFGICVIVCVTLIMIYFNHRDLEALNDKYNEEFEDILALLENFSKGDFIFSDIFNKYSVSNDDVNNLNNENMYRISELCKYLSYYFSDLIERMKSEEESTKSLITDISHQLKTPLSALRVSYELSLTSSLTSTEREEFLANVEYEIEKLEIFLGELMNLSKLESHMIQIEQKPLGVKETITQAVSQVFMKAYEKNIEIQSDIEEDVMLMHDRKWTVEALANIIDNAVKYSYENTNIIVRTEKLVSNILIEIEDEGIGIKSKDIHNIYKRFYRGEEAEKMADDGVGVGLYLARRIIEEQGGTITAKRKHRQGTIFKITLPL